MSRKKKTGSRKLPAPQHGKTAPVSSGARPRYLLPDIFRGSAVVLMIAYHFCYDLTYFRLAFFDFQHHFFWLSARAFIVTLFVFTSGMSFYLAYHDKIRRRHFVRRLGLITACALLVTAGSYWLFPQRYIFFGILHFIVAGSIVALFFLRFKQLNLIIGALCVAAGISTGHSFFNHSALQWLGLMTNKPPTEDYVPMLPWFGVMLWGLYAGAFLKQRAWFRASLPIPAKTLLEWFGRHSLLVYMLHQPLLLGLLFGVRKLL